MKSVKPIFPIHFGIRRQIKRVIRQYYDYVYHKHVLPIIIKDTEVMFRIHTLTEEIILTNHEENHLLDMLSEKLKPNDVIYDIGSHIGYHALYLASQLDTTGVVYAFEPNPNCYEYLLDNISLNPQLKVHAMNIAISESNGEALLSFGDVYAPSAQLVNTKGKKHIYVQTKSLDMLSDELEPPTIIKVDVEGAEDSVIFGGENTLRTGRIRWIMMEFHPTMIDGGTTQIKILHNKLISFGYEVTFQQSRRQQEHVFYRRI